MAIAASGAVSLSDFRSEFVGGSSAISLGDLYRGGSNIRAKAGNNTATNLAANVPTSGAIDFADFYSQAKGFRKTYSSGATNQDASAVFGDDYSVDYPKEIVIDSGVELGATSTSQEALQIDSGLSGSMTITNNGTLSGAGGAANGGAGGDAFEANVSCTLINNGTIRAGGGGGGQGGGGGAGGTGGQGSYSSTVYGSFSSEIQTFSPHSFVNQFLAYGTWSWHWYNNSAFSSQTSSPVTSGGYEYHKGTQTYYSPGVQARSKIKRRSVTNQTTYTSGGGGGQGGGGGTGGVGQGYGQSAGSGSSGSGGSGGAGGGTNAGSGGTGGTGGTGGAGASFGNSGSSGSTGATGNTGGNGNHSNGSGGSGGSGGSSGGAAGRYINGISNVTLTQNGTVQGGTA